MVEMTSTNIKLCDKCEQSCYTCISDMLSAQDLKTFDCDYCHLKLSLEELFKLHWVDQKFMQSCAKHTSFQTKDECDIHGKSYKFYCIDCCKCICEECSFDETLHTDHSFKRIASIYNSCLKNIDKEFEAYGVYLHGMSGVVNDIRANKNEILLAKSTITQDLNAIIEPEKDAITNQVNEKIEVLTVRDDALTKRMEKLEAEKLKLQDQVKTSTKSGLIIKEAEIIKRTALMMERPVKDFESEHVPAKIRCVFLPEPQVGYLQIDKYAEVIQKENYNESDQMTDLLGTVWSLSVSTGEENFEKILIASLKLADGIHGEYLYEIMLMHENDKKSLTFKGNYTFDPKQSGPEQKLLSLVEIEQQGFVVNDFLNVKFTVRAPNILKFSQYQQEKLEQVAAKSSVVEDPNMMKSRKSSHDYTVNNFLDYKRRNKPVCSERITDKLGNTWRFRVHPNGDQDAKEEFVSVFVELMKGIPGKYRYSISLLDQNGTTVYKIKAEDNVKLQEPVGKSKYIRYSDLISENYWNPQADSIDLVFNVCPLFNQKENRKRKV